MSQTKVSNNFDDDEDISEPQLETRKNGLTTLMETNVYGDGDNLEKDLMG